MMLAVFLGLLILLFVMGFSAPYAIGLTSCIVLVMERGLTGFPFDIVATKFAFSANNFTLLAIPFFLLADTLNAPSVRRPEYAMSFHASGIAGKIRIFPPQL